jgi:hypothetical protein
VFKVVQIVVALEYIHRNLVGAGVCPWPEGPGGRRRCSIKGAQIIFGWLTHGMDWGFPLRFRVVGAATHKSPEEHQQRQKFVAKSRESGTFINLGSKCTPLPLSYLLLL